jgi:hypothetical protein
MSIAEKTLLLKQDIDEVYTSGKQAEYNEFWEEVRKSLNGYYAFSGDIWTNETFKPPYPIKTNSGYYMFQMARNLSGDLREMCDLDVSSASQPRNLFYGCSKLTAVGVIDLKGATTGRNDSVLSGCSKLVTVEKIVMYTYNTTTNVLTSCAALENIVFEKANADKQIGISGAINFSSSTKLTHDSLISILEALQDGAKKTCTLGSTNLAKLTDDEKAIATDKGWTLA